MKNIQVVIGANFGDEGKGLMTDYLASRMENGIVVRFNGGAQAGHTVATPDGLRHVFGNVGSGSLTGVPSYLSSFYVVNPMTFKKELHSLRMKGVSPKVYIDMDSLVTTPYDMAVNQIVEINRGVSKHGSCGLGFNETINRNLQPGFGLSVRDLLDEDLVRNKLQVIKSLFTPQRLKQLGIEYIPSRYVELLEDENIIESYVEDVNHLIEEVTLTDIHILSAFDSILFEGAQGLLLDQAHPYFPHVTRSNTGMKNVRELIDKGRYDNTDVEIVYVTRAYLTRHGAGPFPSELPEKPYPRIEDLTNVPNPYQDALRYGLLDLNELREAIYQDLNHTGALNYKVSLAITCLDQLDGRVDYIKDKNRYQSSMDGFIHRTLDILNIADGYVSYGSTRDTVSYIK